MDYKIKEYIDLIDSKFDVIVKSPKKHGFSNLSLPKDLECFYSVCDGIAFNDTPMKILSKEEAFKKTSFFKKIPYLGYFRLFPIFDDNTSDPLCVILEGPLKGMIVHIFHDGDLPNLAYANVLDMLESISKYENIHELSEDLMNNKYSYPLAESLDCNHNKYRELRLTSCEEDYQPVKDSLLLDLIANDNLDSVVKLVNQSDIAVRYKAFFRLKMLNDKNYIASMIDLSV